VMTEGVGVRQAHTGLRLRRRTVVHFFPPVDLTGLVGDPLDRASKRLSLGIPEQAVVVGTLGNHTWQKGHDLLIEAVSPILAESMNVHCLVVGTPVPSQSIWYEREVASRVSALPQDIQSRIHFVEPGSDALRWLNALDVFLLSSRAEGVATATLEAMACSLPVVAFDVGSVREVVACGASGFVVSKEPQEMTRACIQLVDDADLRVQLGRRGRQLVEDVFTLEACVSAHATAYETAFVGSGGGAPTADALASDTPGDRRVLAFRSERGSGR